MSPGPALAPAATTTRRPHTVGAGRRTGWVMVLIVYGEAMLTMQPESAKRRIVREARRLLDDSTGRYALHELCLLPDDLDPALAGRITHDAHEAIRVGARPLTPTAWRELLADEGFTVTAHKTAPTALLEPWPPRRRRRTGPRPAHRRPGPAQPVRTAPGAAHAPCLPTPQRPPGRDQPARRPHPVPALRSCPG